MYVFTIDICVINSLTFKDLYIGLEKEFFKTSSETDIELGRIFQNNPKV
jgi:hypothetical protein